jgi:hypothetical protein
MGESKIMILKRFTIRSLILLTTVVAVVLWILLREPAFGIVMVMWLVLLGLLFLAYAVAYLGLSALAPMSKSLEMESQPPTPFAENPIPTQPNAE